MKLVLVTQMLDPGHAALGQTLDLVDALAERVDTLDVVARQVRTDALPGNVVPRTFDAGSRIGRTVAFERSLAASLGGADAVLVHMVPTFALLAAPSTRVRHVPLLLWYTHWHASRSLRLATRVVDAALSVEAASYPVASPKVRAIGHAIDVERFASAHPGGHPGPLRLLALGRTARWKGFATLLAAFAQALERGLDATLEIRGPSLTDDERLHREELAATIRGDSRLRGRAALAPPVPRGEIPELLAGVDAVVSPVEPRSGAALDKAVYEAAACARPVLTTNSALAPFLSGLPLRLLVPPGDPEALADALVSLGAASQEARDRAGAELRRRVIEGHSLGHWADAVIRVVTEVRSARGTAGHDGAPAG